MSAFRANGFLFIFVALLLSSFHTSFAAGGKGDTSFMFGKLGLKQIPLEEAEEEAVEQPTISVPDTPKIIREPFMPRAEVNWRYGHERSILMSAFFVPVAQDVVDGSLFFGDLRVMGDDRHAREFNFGVGYREMVSSSELPSSLSFLGDGILGGMAWLDHRITERGSRFNQLTFGGEWLAADYDIRVNGYVPLNNENRFSQSNPSGTGGGFVGTQLVVNTDQTLTEEALAGFDVEFGVKVPFLEEVLDQTRLYGAGYHFYGDKADDVSGWRTRLAMDVTEDIQIGARFQRDDVRGSQGFVEATLRFPFGAKKSFQEDGLYSRLDESPERDIDIVSNEAVIDDGLNKPVINTTTGDIQQIIHVDNTADPAAGNGTAETPFNTLAQAEALATDNSVIYVHRGNGTTTGQANGITLDNTGQKLIGSGAALTVADLNITLPANARLTQTSALIQANPNGGPVITNTTGDGITVTADNTTLKGLTVDGASQDGVFALNNSGASWQNLTIDSVITRNNGDEGLRVEIDAGSTLENLSVRNAQVNTNTGSHGLLVLADGGILRNTSMNNITTTGNNLNGLYVLAQNGGQVDVANIDTVRTSGNGQRGVWVSAQTNSEIGTATLENINATGNTLEGIHAEASNANAQIRSVRIQNSTTADNVRRGVLLFAQNGGEISSASLDAVTTTDNQEYGVLVSAFNNGDILELDLQNVIADRNTIDGIRLQSSGVGSTIQAASLNNIFARSNTQNGVFAFGANNGQIASATLQNMTLTSNQSRGLAVVGQSGGELNSVIVENMLAFNNTTNGVLIDDDTLGAFEIDLGGGVLGSSGNNAIFGNPGVDIDIDLDGREMSAENNWWGSPFGLDVLERTLDGAGGGTTIDSDPFLTTAP